MVAHACDLSYSGGWGRRITWIWEVEVAVSWDCAIALQSGWWQEWDSVSKNKQMNKNTNLVSTKNKKISRAWWWVPIVPVTQEAEAGKSLEPGRRRSQWANATSLQPAWWEPDSNSKYMYTYRYVCLCVYVCVCVCVCIYTNGSILLKNPN